MKHTAGCWTQTSQTAYTSMTIHPHPNILFRSYIHRLHLCRHYAPFIPIHIPSLCHLSRNGRRESADHARTHTTSRADRPIEDTRGLSICIRVSRAGIHNGLRAPHHQHQQFPRLCYLPCNLDTSLMPPPRRYSKSLYSHAGYKTVLMPNAASSSSRAILVLLLQLLLQVQPISRSRHPARPHIARPCFASRRV